MDELEPIDLHHLGARRVIGSYVLDTDDGPALFDCGPATTVDTLLAELAVRGMQLTDVRHLLLSHVRGAIAWDHSVAVAPAVNCYTEELVWQDVPLAPGGLVAGGGAVVPAE